MKRFYLSIAAALATVAAHAQVGIGTTTPDASAQLHISSTSKGLLIPRLAMADRPANPATGLLIYQTDDTPGYYYYDGASWSRLSNASSWNTGGNNSTGVEFIGTNNNQPLIFKVNGVRSSYFDTDGSVLALGFRALDGNTGSLSIGIGTRTLLNNAGTYNTAIGYESMVSTTTGSYNTALGYTSLFSNSTGLSNVAVGHGALFQNVSGDNNTSIGVHALFKNISGSMNVAVGNSTFGGFLSGDNNVALGYFSGAAIDNMNNTTSLGSFATAFASNSVRIGNLFTTQIGGEVGWSTISDIRFKTGVKPAEHGLDFVLRLQPITYHIDVNKIQQLLYGDKSESLSKGQWQLEAMTKKSAIRYSGFSAQQVVEAAASVGYEFSAVHVPENEKDHYALDYSAFVVPLVKAVQEQQQMIELLKKELQAVQDELKQLKQKK